jgi:lipopolysaccharide export system protein LptA
VRWQGFARIGVAVAGVGAAVTLYVMTRERPATIERPAAKGVDSTATMQSGRGRDVRYRLAVKNAIIEYMSLSTYDDGRVRYETFTLTMVDDGTTVSADLVDARSPKGDVASAGVAETMDFDLKGNVRLKMGDGTMVGAEEGSYKEAAGLLTIPGKLVFSRGRISGEGNGGTYERDLGTFKVLADARVITAASDQSPGAEATSRTLTYTPASKAMLFDGDAVIKRTAETLSADRATLYLTEDEQEFRVIELRGRSKVFPAPGGSSNLADMSANDIDLAFYNGTQALERGLLNGNAVLAQATDQGPRVLHGSRIEFATAPDGKTMTRLDARENVVMDLPRTKDAPKRSVRAATLASQGNAKNGLTAALFDGGVTFTETTETAGKPAAVRTGTSRELALKLDGQIDAIQQADFRQNVTFVSGDMTGEADLGTYYASKGELWLLPLPGASRRLPHVTDGSVTVDATERITVGLDSDDLYARKDVKAVMKPTGKPGARKDSALFNSKETVLGFGNELFYNGTKKVARYVGLEKVPAKVQQGQTTVIGDEVILDDNTQDLRAVGHVDSRMLVSEAPAAGAKPGTGKTSEYRITSDKLEYKDATRTATYDGNLAKLRSADGAETEAERIVIVLQADSRELRSLDATTGVYLRLPDGREAVGDSLHYDAVAGRYTMRGKALKIKSRNADDGTCSLSTGNLAIFSRGTGAPEFPPGPENPGGNFSGGVPCSLLIRIR